MKHLVLPFFIAAVFLCLFCLRPARPAEAQELAQGYEIPEPGHMPGKPAEPFSPSNVRTQDGKFIPVSAFFPSSRCQGCHADTAHFWRESLHSHAATEPFYRQSVDILLKSRGKEFTRHCESCHTPVALLSGALASDSPATKAPFTPLDDEGVTCTVCHSIVEARPDGSGSFTIRRPALLAEPDGTPIFGDFTDEQILANIPSHRAAMMRPLLKSPEFCGTCHRSDIPPELNGYKHFRGFSAYDEYQQSGSSLESVLPYYRRATRADCRTCHMPRVESLHDRAAREGTIASHRWLGANTAVPLLFGQPDQAEEIERFLSRGVVDLDIFGITREQTGEHVVPLLPENSAKFQLMPGETATAEVVVSNRGAAHSFPAEVRDLYEAWVEFEVIDQTGRSVFHSGFLKPDGMLDQSAHVYKSILIDPSGRVITRHQIWLTTTRVYDNSIPAGKSDLVRFRFRAPDDPAVKGPVTLTLRARLNYRRFNQEYTGFVLDRIGKSMTAPVVQMAEAAVTIGPDSSVGGSGVSAMGCPPCGAAGQKPETPLSKRWNDYGIALMEQAQYGPAAAAFMKSAELNPSDPNPLISAAAAELKTERFGEERRQLAKAAGLVERAKRIDPQNPRVRFYSALVTRAQANLPAAASAFSALSEDFPRDREVKRALGETLYAMGNLDGARAAFEASISIDGQDAAAYRMLSPIYMALGRKADAERAQKLYLEWREDPMAAGIAARFYAAHPEWADERVLSHTHGAASADRPVLTGRSAAPY